MPLPSDSDPRRRRAMKTVTAAASSGSSRMDGSRAVADESRMDVVGEERDESGSSNAQSISRRIMTNTSMEESQMDDEGEERRTQKYLISGKESRQKHHWKGTKLTRERWQ